MNTVHVIVGLGVGGAESMLYKLLEASSDASHKVSVISLTDYGEYGKRLEGIGVDVYVLGLQSGQLSFSGFTRLISLLYKLKPDIVQSWMYHANIAVSLVSIIPFLRYSTVWNIRHALHDMSSEKRLTRILIKLGAFLSWLPQKIIFNSSESLMQHQKIGYSKSKSIVIPNGFDLNVFLPSLDADKSLITSLALPKDVYLIGVVARFHPAKGYKYFVEAVRAIAEESKNAHFILIGRNVDGNNAELNGWIKDTGYSERFHLLGEQKDPSKFFPAFTVLVNPSTTESFPNVIGEAMACGVPCVVTDVGDSRKIIGDYGLTVPAKNSDALSRSVLDLLSLTKIERGEMGLNARERIMQNYSIDAVAKQYEHLYTECYR